MGSHGGDKVDMLKVEETKSSEPTVEIKVKTLDSQTYTLRVDKCVPVPTLKDQIATLTGILSERQRLICRGTVLKDDQLLSAYPGQLSSLPAQTLSHVSHSLHSKLDVEDGHTLHLVVREPIPPSQSTNDHAGLHYPPSAADARGVPGFPRIVVGSFDVSDQGQGGMHNLNQLLSAVFGSMGNASDVGASELPTIVVRRASTLLDSGRSQHASQGPTFAASQEHLHPPVIPDSLTTLSRYLNQVTVEFAIANGGDENSPFQGSPPFESDVHLPEISRVTFRRGLPTPESLAEVLQSTSRLLINQTAESLSRLATQLQNQANVTDASARMSIQSNAMRSGIILRNLGALLLELGRTTMMLRMGENPADAVVNAGSAVFINESGPNPIMVQPFPMGSLHSGVGLGSSVIPRNVDVRIRTGSGNEGEQPGAQQHPEPVGQAASGTPSAGTTRRRAEVRLRPIRAVFGAVPARTSQSADPPRNATGLIFPVMARVQPAYASATDVRDLVTPGGHVGGQPGAGIGTQASAAQYFEEMNSSLDDYLRSMFNMVDEQTQPQTATTDANMQPAASTGASAAAPQPYPAPSDDGIFLSNLLQQIMPHISQNFASGSAGLGDDNGQGNMAHGVRSSLRRHYDKSHSPDSKRQRRE